MQPVVAPSQGRYLGRASLFTHFPITARSCISKLVATSTTTRNGEATRAVSHSIIVVDKEI